MPSKSTCTKEISHVHVLFLYCFIKKISFINNINQEITPGGAALLGTTAVVGSGVIAPVSALLAGAGVLSAAQRMQCTNTPGKCLKVMITNISEHNDVYRLRGFGSTDLRFQIFFFSCLLNEKKNQSLHTILNLYIKWPKYVVLMVFRWVVAVTWWYSVGEESAAVLKKYCIVEISNIEICIPKGSL